MLHEYKHAAFHVIKAVALLGIGLGIMLAAIAAIYQFESMDLDPETFQALGILLDVVGVSILAIFAWSFIEFTAGVWSIPLVRRSALWVRNTVGGVRGDD